MKLLNDDLSNVESDIAGRMHKPKFLTPEFATFVNESCDCTEENLFTIGGQARIGQWLRADGSSYEEDDFFHNGVMVISNEAVYLHDGVSNRRLHCSIWQWDTYELGKRRWLGVNFTEHGDPSQGVISFFFRKEAFPTLQKHLNAANFATSGIGIIGRAHLKDLIWESDNPEKTPVTQKVNQVLINE
jgi:hypothetical protein